MITKDDLKNFIHSSKPKGNNYADINILKEHGSYNLEKQSKIRSLGAKISMIHGFQFLMLLISKR